MNPGKPGFSCNSSNQTRLRLLSCPGPAGLRSDRADGAAPDRLVPAVPVGLAADPDSAVPGDSAAGRPVCLAVRPAVLHLDSDHDLPLSESPCLDCIHSGAINASVSCPKSRAALAYRNATKSSAA